MKSKGVLATILVGAFLIIAGGSFWLGTYYETQSRMSRMRQFGGMTPGQWQQRMGGQPPVRQQGPGLISGKVDKVTPDTLTITTRFGSQKITLTPKTVVNKATRGAPDDIKPGSQIVVDGKGGSREKVEADSIQILSP